MANFWYCAAGGVGGGQINEFTGWSQSAPNLRTGSRLSNVVSLQGGGTTAGLAVGMRVYFGTVQNGGTITTINANGTQFTTSSTGTIASNTRISIYTGSATIPTASDDVIFPNIWASTITPGWNSAQPQLAFRNCTIDSAVDIQLSTSTTTATVSFWGTLSSSTGAQLRSFNAYPRFYFQTGCIINAPMRNYCTMFIQGDVIINQPITTEAINTNSLQHDSGTLTLNADITVATYISTTTSTRTINGTGNINLVYTLGATVISAANLANYTWNCSGFIINNSTTARSIAIGYTTSPIRGPNLRLQGTGSISPTGLAVWAGDFDYQASTALATNTILNVCTWSYSSTNSLPAGVVLNFVGTGNWNNAGRLPLVVNINHTGITTLQTTVTWTELVLTLTQGRIALNGFGLSVKTFSSSNTNVRGINWGSTGATIEVGNSAASGYSALGVNDSTNFTHTNKGTFTTSTTTTKSFGYGNLGNSGLVADAGNLSITTGQAVSTTQSTTGFYEVINLSGIQQLSNGNTISANQITFGGTSASTPLMVLNIVGNNPIYNSGLTSRTIGTLNINSTGTLICSDGLRANTFNHINGDITLTTGGIAFTSNVVGKFGNGTITNASTIQGRGLAICNGGTCRINGGTLQPLTGFPSNPQYVLINNSGGFGDTNFIYDAGDWSVVPYIQQTSGAVTLNANLTILSTGYYTLDGGSINLNANTLAVQDFNSTTTAVVRSITGTGKISASGNWTVTNGTNFTGNTYTIDMTKATSKTFAGGGGGYGKLNQAGAGALTVSGSNSFGDMTATIVPSTITFTSGTTQTLLAFNVNGTSGNLVTLNSTSSPTQFNLSKATGTVSVSWLSVTDSNVGGGATWTASNTTFVSNNTGWGSGPVYTINGQFFQFFGH